MPRGPKDFSLSPQTPVPARQRTSGSRPQAKIGSEGTNSASPAVKDVSTAKRVAASPQEPVRQKQR
jgi:hypothetical protein